MAIIEPHIPGAPLSQGDIFKGVGLFFTKTGADAGTHTATDAKFSLCLVLSRQCVVEHKQSLVVAGVTKFTEDVKPDLTFQESIDFFRTARDGIDAPDIFYLGHLPGLQGRYCARLDSLHTVELPQKPEVRKAFIDDHRIARLNLDFVCDLHIRVHQAFANMGFEDYRWLSDEDLKLVVAKGDFEIKKVEQEQQMARLTRESAGKAADAKQISNEQNRLEGIKKQIEPYANELARRFPEPPATEAGTLRTDWSSADGGL